jgi:penicillin-binding protein 1A
MSTRRRRRGDDLDFILAQRGRKRKRADRIRRRRRAGVIAATATIVVLAIVLSLGLGAGAALTAGCDLKTLRPVAIGQNTFVYARDGSLLGSIPADRNREPVTLRHMSKWLPKATVAIEDRRYWQHGGVE